MFSFLNCVHIQTWRIKKWIARHPSVPKQDAKSHLCYCFQERNQVLVLYSRLIPLEAIMTDFEETGGGFFFFFWEMFSGLWGTFFHLMSGPSTLIVCGVFDHRHKGKILSLPCSSNSRGRLGGHVKNSHTCWVSQSKGPCVFGPFVDHNGEQASLEWLRGFHLGNLLLGSWRSYKTVERGAN